MPGSFDLRNTETMLFTKLAITRMSSITAAAAAAYTFDEIKMVVDDTTNTAVLIASCLMLLKNTISELVRANARVQLFCLNISTGSFQKITIIGNVTIYRMAASAVPFLRNRNAIPVSPTKTINLSWSIQSRLGA